MTKLNEEQKRQMLGLAPMKADAIVNFTPDAYDGVDEEVRPVFRLKQYNKTQITSLKLIFQKDAQLQAKKKKTVEQIEALDLLYMKLLFEVLDGFSTLYDPFSGEEIVDLKTEEQFLSLPKRILVKILEHSFIISGIK